MWNRAKNAPDPNFDPREVAAVRELVAAKPWQGNPGRGTREEFGRSYRACRECLEKLSGVHGIEPPQLRVISNSPWLNLVRGAYNPCTHTILMPKFSVFTLLHEFRHALQHKLGITVNDPEEDARNWSTRLVYAAAPRFYRRAVERGLVLYPGPPAELLNRS